MDEADAKRAQGEEGDKREREGEEGDKDGAVDREGIPLDTVLDQGLDEEGSPPEDDQGGRIPDEGLYDAFAHSCCLFLLSLSLSLSLCFLFCALYVFLFT